MSPSPTPATVLGLTVLVAACGALPPAPTPTDAGEPPVEPRLVVLGKEGGIASIDVTSPWTVRATADLGASVASARCRGERCVVIHPAPDDAVTVIDAKTLTVLRRFELESGAGEMYDLANDPEEMQNLFDDPGYRAKRREMEDLMRARPGTVRETLAEPIGMA